MDRFKMGSISKTEGNHIGKCRRVSDLGTNPKR